MLLQSCDTIMSAFCSIKHFIQARHTPQLSHTHTLDSSMDSQLAEALMSTRFSYGGKMETRLNVNISSELLFEALKCCLPP